MIVQQMNVTTKKIVHIKLSTGQAIFDSCRADGNLSLDDVGGVSIALTEIVAAFVAENVEKIQTRRGSIYNVNTAAWRMIIDACGLTRCTEAMGDYILADDSCDCYGCATMRHACTGVF